MIEVTMKDNRFFTYRQENYNLGGDCKRNNKKKIPNKAFLAVCGEVERIFHSENLFIFAETLSTVSRGKTKSVDLYL